MAWDKFQMAEKVIERIPTLSSVNLGIGMPTAVAERIPANKQIIIHSENGVLGVSGRPKKQQVSPTLINAGKETISIGKGASYFDSSLSFGMIRGGHIDFCILGGMEVDADGNLANWTVPGEKVTGMGGAMDLVNGAKQVFIMMKHFAKNGTAKLTYKCSLPLTGTNVVNLVFTDLGVFRPERGRFRVLELAAQVTIPELKMPADLLLL